MLFRVISLKLDYRILILDKLPNVAEEQSSLSRQIQATLYLDRALHLVNASVEIDQYQEHGSRIIHFLQILLAQETKELGSCCEAVAISIRYAHVSHNDSSKSLAAHSFISTVHALACLGSMSYVASFVIWLMNIWERSTYFRNSGTVTRHRGLLKWYAKQPKC
jgi:hypothetical protein